jgi:hypothetical protein
MSYESKCIRDIVVDHLNRDMFLPAIQREFVWGLSDIEKLFDSLMGDYPISSFLFWKVKEENKKDWTSYKFFSDFDDEDPHNEVANLAGVNKDVYLVLDGQQRLTALNIGLRGSYRFFYYRWRTCRLYLNLLKPSVRNEENPEELTYQFQFREEGAHYDPDREKWYPVSRILDFLDAEDAKTDMMPELIDLPDNLRLNASSLIGRFHSRIHTHKLINYYEEKSTDYDKVVEVFIRANTGGKKLDYSDILLSTATAKWKELNAREEIHNFTDELNTIGSGYSFDKDFVLKSCLYLTPGLPIQYKVKNFTTPNLERIEDNWERIKGGLETTVKLISKFGFTNKNITSAGALLPLAYYITGLGKKNFSNSSHHEDVSDQDLIQKWLALVLLKNAFGGSSDTTLKNVREVLLENRADTFPYTAINRRLGINSSFTGDELEKIIGYNYHTKYSYLVLSLLYPDRDWKDNKYHEDHIYPKAEFTEARLRARRYDQERIKTYQANFNCILNLQLLTDSENLEKNRTPFEEWVVTRDTNFKKRHTIPIMEDYGFDHFLEFIQLRKDLVSSKLEMLGLHTQETQVSP